MPLTVGSLFAGIGGFDLGFERAGFEIRWQVEIDPFCRAVLAKHWPNVRRYHDVRCCGFGRGEGHVEDVDVLCGGFPCQDISDAGRREGIDGARSGLWREMVRLIRYVRPRYVLVENVPALLTRGMDRVLGDLADCGLDAEWDVWGADDFGASQHRKRIWLLAYTNNPRLQGPIWAGQSRAPRQTWPAAHSEPLRSTGGLWPPGPGALADVPRMADGPADRAHRLRSLGNAVVPQIAQWIAERINEAEEQVGSAGLGVA
jgi:DNA (cytosine-5)-methyltransferase 1